MPRPLLGAIEGGGTKFVCALGYGPNRILARERIDTTTPDETLARAADFLADASNGQLAATGIACFGPLELDERRPEFGRILATPKPLWSGVDVLGVISHRLNVPVAIDTDVNGAALGEWRWGTAQGCDPAIYLTVGTGIGGGAVAGGRTLRGLLHPEMGHIPLPRLTWPDGRPDDFAGVCPFHGACFEGLASGPALQARLGGPAEAVAADHPIWELEAGYLAAALAVFTLTLSPHRIVVGGGVMQRGHLLDRVQRRLPEVLGGYVKRAEVETGVAEFVVAPKYGQDAGLIGAFALAKQLLEQRLGDDP